MPLYEYYCEDCHGIFELLRPAREASEPQPCPECDADARRIVSNFEAFVFRDGYPRKIPDDGKHWHLGQKVSTPVNAPAPPNEHPELLKKKRRPDTPPTQEEIDRHLATRRAYEERRQRYVDNGQNPVVDTDMEKRLRAFEKRMRQTAQQAYLKRRRDPNEKSTAKTVSGEHGRAQATLKKRNG